MDRTLSPESRRRRRATRYLRWLALGLAAAAAVYAGLRYLRPSRATDELRLATVERGEVAQTINATALVLPAFEEQVNAPVATTIQEVLLEAGTEVSAGQLLLRLDRDYVSLQLDGQRDQLAIKENHIDLLRLEYDRDLRELGYEADIKALELSAARAELAAAQRLLGAGGATEEDVAAAEYRVGITELEARKLDNRLAYAKNSLAGRRRQLQLEVGVAEKEVRQLSRKLRETEVRAPRAGVLTWVNPNIGQRVTEGAALARIANLGRYRVEGTASDRYAEQLTVGAPVELRLPRGRITGTVTDVLPEVTDNTLKFRVELTDPSSEQLRPNLRTEMYVVQDRRADVLRVRNGPAFRGGRRQAVFVVRGGQAVRTEVTLGLRSGDYVEVVSGLEAGDRIIISDTRDYDELPAIQLDAK